MGATLEARFLIAAFCSLDKSLSCSREKGWLVGAVGIEQNTHRILTELHLKLQSVLLLITNDLAQLKDQLPPSAASPAAQLLAYQWNGWTGTWDTNPRTTSADQSECTCDWSTGLRLWNHMAVECVHARQAGVLVVPRLIVGSNQASATKPSSVSIRSAKPATVRFCEFSCECWFCGGR